MMLRQLYMCKYFVSHVIDVENYQDQSQYVPRSHHRSEILESPNKLAADPGYSRCNIQSITASMHRREQKYRRIDEND